MIQTKYRFLGSTRNHDIVFRITEGHLNEVDVVCSNLGVSEEGLKYDVGILSLPEDRVSYTEDDLLNENKYFFLDRVQFIINDILEQARQQLNGNRIGS